MARAPNKGIKEFLEAQLGMGYGPLEAGNTVLQGEYRFRAVGEGEPPVEDGYNLKFVLPKAFPRDLPEVYEVDGCVSRKLDDHVEADGRLCLGSPLRLLGILQQWQAEPALLLYAQRFLEPYLYCVSLGRWIYGELAHGTEGLVQDYMKLLGLGTPEQVLYALYLLTLPRDEAGRKGCPCGCDRKLRQCEYRHKLGRWIGTRKAVFQEAHDLVRAYILQPVRAERDFFFG